MKPSDVTLRSEANCTRSTLPLVTMVLRGGDRDQGGVTGGGVWRPSNRVDTYVSKTTEISPPMTGNRAEGSASISTDKNSCPHECSNQRHHVRYMPPHVPFVDVEGLTVG